MQLGQTLLIQQKHFSDFTDFLHSCTKNQAVIHKKYSYGNNPEELKLLYIGELRHQQYCIVRVEVGGHLYPPKL